MLFFGYNALRRLFFEEAAHNSDEKNGSSAIDSSMVLWYNKSGIRPSVAPADAGIGIRRPLYKSGLCYWEGQ